MSASLRRAILGVATAVVSLAVAACGLAGNQGDATSKPGQATVVSITDGDTLRVRISGREERVRLIGIDTPETRGRGGLRECFGKEASEHLTRLLPPGTPVKLVRDVEARDRYDRLLAYVYRETDGLFINLALARDGYAAPLTYPPNVAHSNDLVDAAGEARRAGRGLWKACGGPDTRID